MRDQIRRLRVAAGLTQEQLAARLGYQGKQTVSGWETGRSTPPSERLQDLAEVLGATVGDLFPPKSKDEGSGEEA